MSKLTEAARNKLKPSVFGLPDRKAYPMPDAEHAANAKARAKQQLDKGRLSKPDYDHIVTMANHMMAQYRGGMA